MDKRRDFTREFKLAAVRKVIEQGLSYAAVARDLGVGANLVRHWKKSFEADGTFDTEIATDSNHSHLPTRTSPERKR